MCTNVMQGPETNQVSNPKPQQKGNYIELFIGSVMRDINFASTLQCLSKLHPSNHETAI